MAEYRTLVEYGEFHMIEKKSEFIGYSSPCKTVDEANDFISSIQKKHADATHNVFAYSIRENNTARFNDDGEPHGTAGVPVLEVIRKEGLVDCVVVVTRYFGGTLLGAGGLVRAYSAAAKGAIDNSGSCVLVPYVELEVKCEYQDYGKLEYEVKKMDITIKETQFTDRINVVLFFPEDELEIVQKKLNEVLSTSKKYFPSNTVMGPKRQK